MTGFVTVGRVLFGADQIVAEWVVDRLPELLSVPDKMAALGVLDRSGSLIGGVIYHDQRGSDITVSIAASSPKWALPDTMAMLFQYPFGQLGLRRITCLVAESNRRSARFCEGLGFVPEGRLREGAPDGSDMLIFGLLARDCKYLRRFAHE